MKQKDFTDTWDKISSNYEFVEGAQMSNSFIILMALNEAKEPLSTSQISQYISKQSKGNIFKIPATLKETLENRLRPAGYVVGEDVIEKEGRATRRTLYKLTPKGQKLLKGWIGFISAIQQ